MNLNYIAKEKLKLLINDIHHFLILHKKEAQVDEKPVEKLIKSGYPILERQQQQRLKQKLGKLHAADIGHILEGLPLEERLCIWEQIPAKQKGDILLELSEPVQANLLNKMNLQEIVHAAENLDTDEISDLAELAQNLPENAVNQILESLSTEQRVQLEEALSYSEGSVGSLMDFSMTTIHENTTVQEALAYFRKQGKLPENSHLVYVVDRDNVLKGYLPLQNLVTMSLDEQVRNVMSKSFFSFAPTDDALEAYHAFQRYELIAAPVVDDEGKLIGRLCVNDILEFMAEYEEERMRTQIGFIGKEDRFSGIWKGARNRWLWLAINLLCAFIATRVISAFEDTITEMVMLATLMPIVASTGGNIGNQTCTLIIRSLALGQITENNIKQFFLKEIGISFINGLVWGGAMGFIVGNLYSSVTLGFVMMTAIALNLLLAAFIGVAVPVYRYRHNLDPAMGSHVVVTFFSDSFGFLVFLSMAALFLSPA